MEKAHKYLGEQTSVFSISIFRILFGVVLVIQSVYWVGIGFINENIINPSFLFPFIKGLAPLPDFFMLYGLNGGMIVSAALIITNKFYRIGLFTYFISFTYLWLLCQGFFNNHYYLISILCFLLIFPNSTLSKTTKTQTSKVFLFSIQAFIVGVYAISGINKLNPYWLVDLQPIAHILDLKFGVEKKSFLVMLFSYTGVLFDLLIGPLLFLKRTRFFAIGFGIFFHLINFFIFYNVGEIGIFPFLMISSFVLFINPIYLEEKIFPKKNKIGASVNCNKQISKLLIAFLIIQLLVPFRHVFFKGYVDYNGIGQRFSWRLKNMYKEPKTDGLVQFTVLTTKGDTVSTFNLFNMNKADINLTDRQINNLFYYPNMIPVFAQKTEHFFQTLINNKNFDFIISATCDIGFMGRSPQSLLNSSTDLTSVSTSSWETNHWLNPLEQKPWEFK